MPINNITLCSRALVRIGAVPMTSFSDGTAESEIAATLYESVKDALLSAYGWSFATAQVALTQLSSDPAADYAYAFGLPNDFLRALSAGSSTKSRGANFRIVSGGLHTNVSAVTLNYIAAIDESAFPPYFAQALLRVWRQNFVFLSRKIHHAPKRFSIWQSANMNKPDKSTPNKTAPAG